MNDAARPEKLQAFAPTAPRDRVGAIDALRGFALFGVLAINLHTEFRVTLFEQFFLVPMRGLDRAAATLLSLAFELKAITLFSILFGVGLAIQFERLTANPRRTALLVRRLLVLLGFGLIHLLLIWNGDILTEYALAGLLILPLLYAPAWLSLVTAVVLFIAYRFIGLLPLPFSFPNTVWMTQHIAQARAVYGRGAFADVMAFRITEIPSITSLLGFIFPRTMGLMAFGAWLWRVGLFRQLHERSRFLMTCAAMLIPVGLLLTLENYGFLSLARNSPAAEALIDDLAPIALALGYAALLLGVSVSDRVWPAIAWMAPVGRMAFSNYITQSIVLGFLFYGYGFGLMGRVGAAAGVGIAVAIYATQVVISRWWLERYRFGPLEWLWRTVMYGERQPWRRRAAAPAIAPAGALP
jgi:uncharacterized protein